MISDVELTDILESNIGDASASQEQTVLHGEGGNGQNF